MEGSICSPLPQQGQPEQGAQAHAKVSLGDLQGENSLTLWATCARL